MEGLVRTIGSLFDPLLNFFQQIRNYIVFIFSFLRDLIDGFYYGFNTLISNLRSVLSGIIDLSFFSDSSDTFTYLGNLLGFNGGTLFNGLFLICVFFVGFKFVYGLIPFFKK